MDKERRPDRNSLAYWQDGLEKEIARDLRYSLNRNFSKALEGFRRDRVKAGAIEDFFRPLAIGYFGNWEPPLKKRKKKKEEKKEKRRKKRKKERRKKRKRRKKRVSFS